MLSAALFATAGAVNVGNSTAYATLEQPTNRTSYAAIMGSTVKAEVTIFYRTPQDQVRARQCHRCSIIMQTLIFSVVRIVHVRCFHASLPGAQVRSTFQGSRSCSRRQ